MKGFFEVGTRVANTRARRVGAALAAVWTAGLMTACGGGSTQYKPFVPVRILSFGDEMSALTSDGHKWAINYISATGAFECMGYPLWTQTLAVHYGMYYPQCTPPQPAPPASAVTFNTSATTFAEAGATAVATAAQMQSYTSSTGFGSSDLVTVLAGGNDVWAVYASYDGSNEATLIANLESVAGQLAAQVNSVADQGARVLISTIPDQGLTPNARIEAALHTDTDRAALLSRLSTAYNTKLRLGLRNDGSQIGLLLADDMTRSMDRFSGTFGLSNVETAVCGVALPGCTNLTLVGGVSNPELYMWADGTRPGVRVHYQLGTQAVSRTQTNPF